MLHVIFDSGTNSSKKKQMERSGYGTYRHHGFQASTLDLQGAVAGRAVRTVRTALLSQEPRRLQHKEGEGG